MTNELSANNELGHAAVPAPSNAPAAIGAGGGSPYAPAVAPSTNTMALLSFIFCLLGGLLGIVFGHIALAQIKRTGESGRGLAIAGLVIGYGWIALFLGFLALAFTISSLNGAI